MSARRVGVIGLGRSGAAAVQLAMSRDASVYACDDANTTALAATADPLVEAGAVVQLGGFSRDELTRCDLFVLSPGVPDSAPVVQAALSTGAPLIAELEYAFRALRCPVIAVTGTNGKSTTTALIAHILEHAGVAAPAAGNIGLPLSLIAMRASTPAWVVVEVSSFQLAHVERFAPRIGVVTNLSPDHLDRYESVDAYYADKARLFANARADDVWVLNGDDPAVRRLPGNALGERRYFQVLRPLAPEESGAFLSADAKLVTRDVQGDGPLLSRSELPLLGAHNVANTLAAALAVTATGLDRTATVAGLRSFTGLEHRLEVVVERGGVVWINDSKATNVASTQVALESMTRPTVVLLGGRHKGESYASLTPALRRHARYVLVYGEAGEQIEADLAGAVRLERVSGSFEDVVERASEIAAFGDAVLLSPACASFDMFRDYEDRGRQFKRLALGRAEVGNAC